MKKILILIAVLGLAGCNKKDSEQDRLNEPFIGVWTIGSTNHGAILFTKDFKTKWEINDQIVFEADYHLFEKGIRFKNITVNDRVYPTNSEIVDSYEFNEDQNILTIGHFAPFNRK